MVADLYAWALFCPQQLTPALKTKLPITLVLCELLPKTSATQTEQMQMSQFLIIWLTEYLILFLFKLIYKFQSNRRENFLCIFFLFFLRQQAFISAVAAPTPFKQRWLFTSPSLWILSPLQMRAYMYIFLVLGLSAGVLI